MSEYIINSESTRASVQTILDDLQAKHGYLRITIKTGKQRSGQQNKSLHVYLRMLADALNDAGYDMEKTLKPGTSIPWTDYMAKEYLWRPIQEVMTGKESTTEPKTTDYPEIYETLNRLTAQKFAISLPWPCEETQLEGAA